MESDLLVYTNALTRKIFKGLYLSLKPSVGEHKAKSDKKEKKYLRLETDSSEERLKVLPKASVEIQTESYSALYSELIEKDKEIDKLRQELLSAQLELERRLSHEKARVGNEEDTRSAENRVGEFVENDENERRVDENRGIEERVFVSKKHKIDGVQRKSVLNLSSEDKDMKIEGEQRKSVLNINSEDNDMKIHGEQRKSVLNVNSEDKGMKIEGEQRNSVLNINSKDNELKIDGEQRESVNVNSEDNDMKILEEKKSEIQSEDEEERHEIPVETQEINRNRPEFVENKILKPQKLTKINTPRETKVETRVSHKKANVKSIKAKKKSIQKPEAHPFALSDSSSGPEHPSTPVSPTNPPTPDLNSEVSSLKSYGDLAKMLENDGLVAPTDGSHPFLDPVPSLPPLFPSFDHPGLKIESFAFDPSFPIINKALTSKVSQPERLISSQQSNLRSRNSSLPWTEDLDPPIDNFPQPKIKSRSTKHRPRTQEKAQPSKPDVKPKYSGISRKLPTLPTKEKYNVSKKPKSHMNMRPKAKKLANGDRKRTNRVREDALDEIIFNEAQDSETWSKLMIKFRQNPNIVERLLKKDRRPVTQEAIMRHSRKPKIEERHTSGGQRNSESSIDEKEIWIPSIYNFPKRDNV